jgi:hypothetical protein
MPVKLLNKKIIFICLYGVVGFVLYFIQFTKPEHFDINMAYRRIDTIPKLFFNGYFGFFFNVKNIGLLNWLLLPLSFYYLLKNRQNIKREDMIFYFTLLLILALICVKGFFNSRYQFTLYPIGIFILIHLLKYVNKNYLHFSYFGLFTWMTAVIIFNNLMYFTLLKDPEIGTIKRKSKYAKIYSDIHAFQIAKASYDSLQSIPHLKKRLPGKFSYIIRYADSLQNIEKWLYPSFCFLQKLPKNTRVLINNLPLAYYRVPNIIGLYYWCGDDIYFSQKGETSLLKNRNFSQITSFLRDTLHCEYVISSANYNSYSPKFTLWLGMYGKPVCYDLYDFVVYKITDLPGNYKTQPFQNALQENLNQQSDNVYVDENLTIIKEK